MPTHLQFKLLSTSDMGGGASTTQKPAMSYASMASRSVSAPASPTRTDLPTVLAKKRTVSESEATQRLINPSMPNNALAKKIEEIPVFHIGRTGKVAWTPTLEGVVKVFIGTSKTTCTQSQAVLDWLRMNEKIVVGRQPQSETTHLSLRARKGQRGIIDQLQKIHNSIFKES